jgi:hypothetical protein
MAWRQPPVAEHMTQPPTTVLRHTGKKNITRTLYQSPPSKCSNWIRYFPDIYHIYLSQGMCWRSAWIFPWHYQGVGIEQTRFQRPPSAFQINSLFLSIFIPFFFSCKLNYAKTMPLIRCRVREWVPNVSRPFCFYSYSRHQYLFSRSFGWLSSCDHLALSFFPPSTLSCFVPPLDSAWFLPLYCSSIGS